MLGSLPSEICLLKDMESMVFQDNMISGGLPTCLATLSSLEEIDVNNNSLSGPIPPGLFALPSLEILVLSNNQFSGSLDMLFSDNSGETRNIFLPAFHKLRVLRLENNLFEDSIPTALAFLGHLKALSLQDNQLDGDLDGLCTHDLSLLSADCGQVTCTCCTLCY